MEGILNDKGFLVVVPSGFQDETGMVIEQRGQVSLNLFSALAYRQL